MKQDVVNGLEILKSMKNSRNLGLFFVKKTCIIIASGRKWCIVGQKWKIVVAVGEGKQPEEASFIDHTMKIHHEQSVVYPGSCLLGSLAA